MGTVDSITANTPAEEGDKSARCGRAQPTYTTAEDRTMKTITASLVAASVLFGTAAWAGSETPDLYASPLLDRGAPGVAQVQPGQGDSYASVLLDRGAAKAAGGITLADGGNLDLYGCPLVTAIR
jgi:hypothetical protein